MSHLDVGVNKSTAPWFLYLLECEGGKMYAGITTDVQKRFNTHCEGKGAKYTRANKPVRVLGSRSYENRSKASIAEAAIKRLKRDRKLDFLLCSS